MPLIDRSDPRSRWVDFNVREESKPVNYSEAIFKRLFHQEDFRPCLRGQGMAEKNWKVIPALTKEAGVCAALQHAGRKEDTTPASNDFHPVGFIQHFTSERITKLKVCSTGAMIADTEHGSQVALKAEGIEWPCFSNQEQFRFYVEQFYFIIAQCNDGQYTLKANAKGNGGGNNVPVGDGGKRRFDPEATKALLECAGDDQNIDELLLKGADYNARNRQGCALELAFKNRHDLSQVYALLNAGADPCLCKGNLIFERMKEMAQGMTKTRTLDLLKKLHKHGADVHWEHNDGSTLADAAIDLCLPEVLEWLLSLGIALNRDHFPQEGSLSRVYGIDIEIQHTEQMLGMIAKSQSNS